MMIKIKRLSLMFLVLLVANACGTTSTFPEAKQENTLSAGSSESVQSVSDRDSVTVAASKIKIDGSSTVYPITDAIARKLQLAKTSFKGGISVNFSGTGGGFDNFCTGKTDISNASRPILKNEMGECEANGIEFIELPIAYDALTVVVNVKNSWVKDITIAELKKIWEPAAEGKITRWNQVRSSYPDRPINLYGPGTKSGTFDYFTDAVIGKTGASRQDYIASEDDFALVRGVSKDPDSLGYFGYAYYKDNQGPIKALAIDGGNGAVLPSRVNVEEAQYQPLSRPLFIYVNADSLQSKPELVEFVNYYLENVQSVTRAIGYVPLPEKLEQVVQKRFNNRQIGTLFAGEETTELKIQQLLEIEQKNQ